jgi:hypothetical protein
MGYLFRERLMVVTAPKIMFRKRWGPMLIHISPTRGFPARITRMPKGARIMAGIMAETP